MMAARPNSLVTYTGQLILLGLFVALLMVFSNSPSYEHFPPGQALIKVSISHAGQVKGACRKRTPAELAKLSPNMRVTEVCPRERSDVAWELELDGTSLFSESLPPSGLKRDGISSTYQRFAVTTGKHRLVARLKDHAALPEFNYSKTMEVSLSPAQVFVIDFQAKEGGFIFR